MADATYRLESSNLSYTCHQVFHFRPCPTTAQEAAQRAKLGHQTNTRDHADSSWAELAGLDPKMTFVAQAMGRAYGYNIPEEETITAEMLQTLNASEIAAKISKNST